MASQPNGKPEWEDESEATTLPDSPQANLPTPLTHDQRVKMFGHFDYVAEPLPSDPERIRVMPPWVFDNLVTVTLPFQGYGATHARVHKLIAKQFTGLMAAWK